MAYANKTHYQVDADCSNCGQRTSVRLRKGTPITTVKCSFCGCKKLFQK